MEEVQSLLGDCKAVELVILIISSYSDPDLINEALLLATSLLSGGNEKIQNLFLKGYHLKGCEEIFLRLYEFLLSGFNKI